jgi:hypothetical protein
MMTASIIPLIVSEGEAAKSLRLAQRTLQRMRLEGGGPPYIQLSERRIGYSVVALEAWIASRSRASTSAARPARGVAA